MTDSGDDTDIDELARALRAATLGAPACTVASTRARIVNTARRRAEGPSWTLAAAAALMIVLGGSTVWAFVTGRLTTDAPEPPRATEPRTAELLPPPRMPAPRAQIPEPIAPAVEPSLEPHVEAHVEPATLRAPVERDVPRRIDPAERRAYDAAHALHFGARDWPAAVPAWDAYLASFPRGRFALEARYNRALALVQAGRERQGAEALVPFAEGRYGAYRRTEAQALLDALEP